MVQERKGRKARYMVQIRDASGKVLTRSFDKKSDAIEFESKERQSRQLEKAGMAKPKDNVLFVDYAGLFLRRRFKDLPKATVGHDESRLRNYWLEKFGRRALTTMTTQEISEHLDHIQYKLDHSVADRNRHRALLHRLFKEALRDGKVVYNPVSAIPLKDERKTARPTSYLDAEADQAAYISAAYAEGPEYELLANILIWSGLRIGEAIALQLQDIDLELGVIRVRRIWDRAENKLAERVKGKRERAVPLFPVLRDAIESHKRGCEFIRPTDFVTHRASGDPISYDGFKGVHQRIVKAAGVKRITPHDLRRTFASNAQRAGFSKGEIQEMLGHSSVLVTERYTRLEAEHLIEKAKRLGFGKKKSNRVSAVSAKK